MAKTLPPSGLTTWRGPHTGRCQDRRGLPFGSSSVQHGTAVFEGIRAYASCTGETALFRAEDHLTRLLESARILGIRHDLDHALLLDEVVRAASEYGEPNCYVRPGLFATDPYLSIDLGRLSFTLGIEVWPMPAHTPETAPPGARLTVSPWHRPSPLSFPPRAKAVGTYVTSALAKTAAVDAGFDDALQLDPHSGRIAEATTSNVFIVRDWTLFTPWLTDSLLAGITRDTVITLAHELGLAIHEGPVDMEDLESAEEMFLTGTASELQPVASIDDRALPKEHPVFDMISAAFQAAVTGTRFTRQRWLTPVPTSTQVSY
ncbi:aminotransferase class IV [Streptomyces longisporoflavus]|uniref:Aminotransferase class IV n=1 Tax=Streptomyces longisporoflavus TaxID=28044 RepID=A0ABW7R3S6_9ACTN